MSNTIPSAPRQCLNCNTLMQGPWCAQCGQHERSSVRHFSLLLRDIVHDVLDLDSRALRTLKPLFLRPGFLTAEYFAGRRQRYVPPLRLYVILSLMFFLAIKLLNPLNEVNFQSTKTSETAPSLMVAGQEKSLAFDEDSTFTLISPDPSFPESVNAWLKTNNEKAARLLREDPRRLVDATLSVLPQSMFIALPLFALLLKLCYPLSGRYYIEHLMVAFHSHSFIYFTLSLTVLLELAGTSVQALSPLLGDLIGWGQMLLLIWIPLYLLQMQKQVYQQGWGLTLFKYFLFGTLYSILLAFTVLADLFVGVIRN